MSSSLLKRLVDKEFKELEYGGKKGKTDVETAKKKKKKAKSRKHRVRVAGAGFAFPDCDLEGEVGSEKKKAEVLKSLLSLSAASKVNADVGRALLEHQEREKRFKRKGAEKEESEDNQTPFTEEDFESWSKAHFINSKLPDNDDNNKKRKEADEESF